MKNLFKASISAALLFVGSLAFADTTVFDCVVQSQPVVVTMNISLGDDQSSDFITMTLTEKAGASTFYSQIDKGQLAQQIASGYVNLLALTDQTAQPDGVITNAGFMALAKDDSGAFTGFLAAKGNIYPLTCTGKK